ncbi:transcriptional regulator family: Helix-turn-helix [Penicillium roqueforti]|nr:transcriptional regulator family: Helix-turn-helix [Penicillium roqueforti]KAI2740841.1 transcriptional regulator family: Helix-turn-helix [Penicillium roqueforti]KAI3200410.1 transcriptional regulator family: Helix-turn-helix [Penicillium roqueforti]
MFVDVVQNQAGATQSKLALDFRCSRRTIYNTLKRFKEHNTVKSLPRTGCPRIFSDRTRHLLFILARRHPFWSYKTLSCAIPGQKGRFQSERN